METKDNVGLLYNALKQQGFNDIGDESVFRSKMSDENNRKLLYDALHKQGYNDIGDYKAFNAKLSSENVGTIGEGSVARQVVGEYDSSANNNIDLSQSNLSPYVRGKGKDTQIFGVPYTQYQQMSPEEQSKRYSEAIEQKKQDEKNYFSNYISTQMEEIDKELNQKRDALPAAPGTAFIPSSASGAAQRYGNTDNRETQDKYTSLHAAKNLLDDANKIVEESKKGDTGFFSSLGRGFKDKFVDTDNWNMGLTDTAYSGLLRKAIEKEELGNELSPEESKLLDAAAVNMATQAFFSSDLGRGYKAGNTTAQSIPFMLEFAINPISSTGNAMAKGLLKYGLKRFGRVAASNGAKVAGRIVGDAAAAAGMTATSSLGRVAAGTNERMIGDVQAKVDDGEIKYAGRENGMDTGEALAKSAASNFLENQSEMFFNAFAGGGKMAIDALNKVIPGLPKLSNSEIVQTIGRMANNPMVKDVAKRTQFHGIFGEYAEEVYNNLANIPLGEMTFEQATDLDNNIDTFLGLAPTSVAFGLLGIGGMAKESYSARKNLRRFTEGLNENDKQLFEELHKVINDGNNDIAKSFIKRTLADDDLTTEQKKERIFAVQDMQKEKAVEEIRQEHPNVISEDIAANKIPIYREFVRADRKAKQVLPEEIVSQLPAVNDVESFASDNNLNDAQKDALLAYTNAHEAFSIYREDVNRRRQEVSTAAQVQAVNDVERISNQDTGTVVQAKHKFLDNPVYMVGGRLSFGDDGLLDRDNSDDTIYYLDENGDRKMSSVDDFDSVLSEDSKDNIIGMQVQNADQQFIQEEDTSLNTPDIPAPQRGDRVVIGEDTYLIEDQDVDAPGNYLAVKLGPDGAIDVNNGKQISLSSDEYYSAKEAELWGDLPSFEETNAIEEESATEQPVIMPQNSSENEVATLGEEGNVSQNDPSEESKEERLRIVVESLPRKKDGKIDYKSLTPQQQYEYTSVTEGEQTAVNDLKDEITAREKQLEKMNERLTKVTGGEKAEVRDAIREHKSALDELNTFYRQVVPSSELKEETSGEINQSIPNDLRTDEDYISWIADNSEDSSEILGAYSAAKELASHEQTLKPWQKELLGRKIRPDSFNRFGDRNHVTGGLAKAWLRKDGEVIDTLAQELSTFGGEVSEQDIIDFILDNPTNHVSQVSESMRSLSSKFSDIATREMGIPVSGPESNTGKLYIRLKEANQKLAELSEQQKIEIQGALSADMEASDEQRIDWYSESLNDYAAQYDQFRNEMDEEAADEAIIQEIEASKPELYDGFTADELDDIYSQLNYNDGTERQTEDSGEDQSPLFGEEIERNSEPGAPKVTATENSEDQGENRVAELENNESIEATTEQSIGHKNKYSAPHLVPGESVLDYADRIAESKRIFDAGQEVETNPTDAQKEAGNYKKGHVKVDGYDISIENAKGSERSGVDTNGQPWSVTMNNSYGYIRKTEGADGDHIDVFLSDNPSSGNVYVVDQVNEDGSFDEHKVMYGFSSIDEAKEAYLANYSPGWKGLGNITEVSKEDFKKWVESSESKINPFYADNIEQDNSPSGDSYTINKRYHKKNGSYIYVVNFTNRLDRDAFKELKSKVKEFGGYYSSFGKGGFIFDNEADGRTFADTIVGSTLSETEFKTANTETFSSDSEINPVKEKFGSSSISTSAERPSDNRLVTDERYAELRERMRKKLGGQMNIGIDPEILAIGTEMAVYHIEKGSRKFADYAKGMIRDLGDAIRPYLKAFYNGARDLPEMEDMKQEMSSYEDVSYFDVANFDKSIKDVVAMSEQIARETSVDKQVSEAKKKSSFTIKRTEKKVPSQKESAPVVMQDLFNQNVEENGSERRSEEANSRLGETQREETEGVQGRGMDRSRPGDIRPNKGRSGRLSDVPATDGGRDVELSEKKNQRNNRNERGKDYAPASPKARFDANIAAIRLMRELTERTGTPTSAEMQVLRRYSGWGGLGTFFNNERTTEWQILRELLSEEEYEAAAMSINSAYYTPASVTDTLWDAAEKLGFKGGTILEGSAGIGNIIGAMPDGISERSSIEAVEIDEVSGNILKLLYPDAKVHINGFQDINIKNGSVDLAITNVPFVTGLHVYDKVDKDLSRKFKNIHDFCIAKNIRKLREGGIGIFITSNGTLDKSRTLREWIIGQGKTDVIGAFRLNNETFGGTNATSDIIIVQKRIGNQPSAHAIDVLNTSVVRTGEYETGELRWDKKLGRDVKVTKPVVMEYNSYFVQHPENMAGEMAFAYEKGDTFRPGSVGLYLVKGQNQQKMLQQWIEGMTSIVGERMDQGSEPQAQRMETTEKEGTLLLNKDGELCVSQRGEAVLIGANKNKVKGYEKSECLNDYNAIKTALDEVLQYQVANEEDGLLKPLLKKLNQAYDNFVAKYGPLNRNTSISFLKNDVDFPSISALEDYREAKSINGEKSVCVTKTNVFNRRVIGYKAEPSPTTVKDGVIASVYKFGGIDLSYIAGKLGQDQKQVKSEILDERIGFVNPTTGGVEVRYEYLSGNVREKLELAKLNNAEGEYTVNIEELEKVIPMDIPAHLIEFSLGSSWIDPQLYQQFLSDEFGITDSRVEHVEGAWIMNLYAGKNTEKNRQAGVYSEMFNVTIYGDELVSAALNNRAFAVKRIIKNSDGSTETLTDKDATQACTTRIAEIKDSFKEWARGKMQQDEVLAEKMMRTYNDKFNAIVPKSIDDMFLPERFGGAAESVSLYPHQKKSVIRGTTEPLMLAHEVGTGKTFTLISTAMEMRRIGTAKKPMIVVQNATVGQFVSEAKKLYPNANILTLSERDRTPEGRRAFYGKIKYSDWDIIVVPQSTFEMIPDSPERQMTFIRERIDDKMHALEAMREAGADEQVIKGMEKELDDLEIEFATVASGESATKKDAKSKAKAADNASVKAREQLDRRTDDVQYFDEMGVDAILVDEAHEYKRLGFATMMTRGVKGIDPVGSKKAAGVYLKTRVVLEQNGWKNVVFATGTPISNTAAELWTFMKYLMPKEVMVANEIYYFDDFVRNFGNISQSLEFATNGKFKENTRFASYINKPELVRLWASVSDTVLTKEVNYVNDKVPVMESGKAQDIYLPQSDGLIDIMRAVRKRLDEFEQMSGREKRANSSIPLTMYGIAKRAAIDTRLVDRNASDDPNSKTNKAVEETLRSLKETDSYKGTVAIFCDNQRRWDGKVVGFDLFEDMKQKLVEKGVPQEQIVIMKSGMSIPQKEKIFTDVNAGNVRVIIGNTQTLGTGVNIQERLHTLVHMDAPDRPMDYTQRNGRILRQGNLHRPWNKTVRILRFGVEDSLDVTSYQRLKTKASFIDSIMDGKGALANNQENRTLEEEEEGLFDNPVAVLSGSQYALLKNQAEREYRKYANKKVQYEADQIYITNRLRRNEGKIKTNIRLIEEKRDQVERLGRLFPDGVVHEVKIAGKVCRTDTEIDSALRELVNKPIGEKAEAARKNANYRGEKVVVRLSLDGVDVDAHVRISRESVYDNKVKSLRVVMHKDVSYSCEALGLNDVPVSGGYVRNALDDLLDNVVSGRDARESMEALVSANEKMMEENGLMKERNGKPFGYEKELKVAWEKVGEYTDLMRKEMEEKEAKYADRGSDSVELDVIESESILGEDIETRYGVGEFSLDQERGIPIEKAMSVVSKFEMQVKNHPHISLIDSEADIEQLKEYGVKDQVIDDLKKNAWGNENVVGVYIDSAKIMVMFPSHARNEEHLESFMWHENVHYAISNKGIEEKELLTNACLDFVKNKYNDIYENIVNQYADAPDVWAEESVAYLLQEMLEQNGANKLLNAKFAGNEDISNLFTQLFNFINDGTRRKYNQFRRDANKDGGTEKEVQGNDGNGIKLGKSLERSREEDGTQRGDKGRPDNGEEIIRFHNAQQEKEPNDGTIERYEEELKKQYFKAKEAYLNSMLALKKLQEVIEEHSGEKLKSFENAYMAENHMSSKSTRETEVYGEQFFKPMLLEVGNLMKAGASHREVIDYMIAKHGLERNEVFAMRDAELEASKKYDKQISDLQREYDKGHLQEDEFEEKSDNLKLEKVDFIEKQYSENRGNDFSGLSSLTGEEDYEAAAKEMVDAFEERFDTASLWGKINAATKETLRKSYESGMMSKPTYKKVKNQFKYYIPLRGWNEQTAADVYEYFNSEVSPVNSVLKSAKGRTSIADDPLAVIGNMAESTILQGNRNLMKQRFMNMAINHPSDLLSISEAWYVMDSSSGEWTISCPYIEENDSADIIAQKVADHESRMLERQKNGEATKVSDGLNINYRINSNQAKEHIVSVKRNGKDYLIYVNGNPRAAQAVNGLTNPDVESNKVLEGISKLNRQLAANFTTRNPAFVASNLARDLIFSTSAVFVKEDPIYAIRYTANIPKAMKIAMRNISGKAKDELFEEFLINGGETGYTALHNVDEYKRMIKKELGDITGKTDYFKHVKACAHFFSMMNRWAEDVSRFNAFMTSRELGRSVTQSVHDAKEVTVNFNKKGSGYKTGGVFGISAGIFRNFYLFFNAAVQSLANFGRLAKKNKAGFGIMIGGFTTAGFIVPVLNTLAVSLFGDDDDDYYNNLSDWERRNNLCIYVGNGAFMKVPLPIELRAFYGLGEMAYQETIGNGSNGKDVAYKAINQMTELLPINPLGNSGDLVTTLMPDILKPFWQINENMDFMGKPIYRDNSFNKTMPEWTKAYRGTSKWLVNLSEWSNELAGGDKYKTASGFMNWNPAKVEHLFESYFGGMATTINQTGKTLSAGMKSIIDGEKNDELTVRNMPVINRFVSDAKDDRTSFGKINTKYFELFNQYEETKKNLNGYIKEASTGNIDYLKKLSELQNSKEYEVYIIFKQYQKQIDKIRNAEKKLSDDGKNKALQEEVAKLKKELIKRVEEI